ncbi:hypothetical protein Tco_0382124 [Tanacetum coccineum]
MGMYQGISETKTVKGCNLYKKRCLMCKNKRKLGSVDARQSDWKDETEDDLRSRNWKHNILHGTTSRGYPIKFTFLDLTLVQDDQDETDDLDQERDLLASLIQKLKCEIDDSKNRNKFLESSNKELVDKLKGSRGTDLYSITLQDSTTPNPICLMAKATSSQA